MGSSSTSPAAKPPAQGGSAVNKVNLVSAKLSGDRNSNNYKSWKDEMLCIVERQGMLGFIDGNCKAPPPQHDYELYALWRRSDLQITSWILAALSDEVVKSVLNVDSARDVWLVLENKFGKPQEEERHDEYLALYKAAMSGDWDTAKQIVERNPSAVKGRLTPTLETALHIAVSTGKSISFVRNMVDSMIDHELAITDYLGLNPLHVAAVTGNLHAAEILIHRLPDLLYVPTHSKMFPIHLAAEAGHRQTLELLISHTRDDLPINPFAGEKGLVLLNFMIDAEFFDVAMDLVDKYPHLARLRPLTPYPSTGLKRIALRQATFCIESQLNLWERLVYSCIQLEKEPHVRTSDSENQNCCHILGEKVCERWRIMISKLHSTHWKLIIQLVPCIEWIHKKKLMHAQGLELVRRLCQHMESLTYEEASAIYRDAIITAARLGMHDVIQEIVGAFPAAVHYTDPVTKHNLLHWAEINPSEKVSNLMYRTSNSAPSHLISVVHDTALGTEMEMLDSPHTEGQANQGIFMKEDRNLKVEGENWRKDMAHSCITIATFIVTTVFSAAMSIPGGNESSAFTIFAVSDALALFTSTASLLMFLSILMSEHVGHGLPKKLYIGLLTLCSSVLFMMIAFSSAYYLACRNALAMMPVPLLACLIILSFALRPQLLTDVIHGRRILGKQTNRPFP